MRDGMPLGWSRRRPLRRPSTSFTRPQGPNRKLSDADNRRGSFTSELPFNLQPVERNGQQQVPRANHGTAKFNFIPAEITQTPDTHN